MILCKKSFLIFDFAIRIFRNGSTSRASEEPVPAKKTSSSRRKTRHVQSRSGSEDEMELGVEKGYAVFGFVQKFRNPLFEQTDFKCYAERTSFITCFLRLVKRFSYQK